ncbi:hypothetical protein ACFLX9_02545 [Chloroflexota bacterium]
METHNREIAGRTVFSPATGTVSVPRKVDGARFRTLMLRLLMGSVGYLLPIAGRGGTHTLITINAPSLPLHPLGLLVEGKG